MADEQGYYLPPPIDAAHPERAVLDGFKAAIAAQLSRVFAISLDTAFSAIDLPKKLDATDLTVPIPRLKLKGNPNELAKKVQNEVDILSPAPRPSATSSSGSTRLLHRIRHCYWHLCLLHPQPQIPQLPPANPDI